MLLPNLRESERAVRVCSLKPFPGPGKNVVTSGADQFRVQDGEPRMGVTDRPRRPRGGRTVDRAALPMPPTPVAPRIGNPVWSTSYIVATIRRQGEKQEVDPCRSF